MNTSENKPGDSSGGDPGIAFLVVGVLIVVAIAGAFAFFLYSRMVAG